MAACTHNTMVERVGDPEHAWECADCGHVYGIEPEFAVIIMDAGHCAFASSRLSRDEAETLKARMGEGQIVSAAEALVYKRQMAARVMTETINTPYHLSAEDFLRALPITWPYQRMREIIHDAPCELPEASLREHAAALAGWYVRGGNVPVGPFATRAEAEEIAAIGTDGYCPKHADGHEPDWKSATLSDDGDTTYVDINCKHCGRSGCLGNLKMMLENLSW